MTSWNLIPPPPISVHITHSLSRSIPTSRPFLPILIPRQHHLQPARDRSKLQCPFLTPHPPLENHSILYGIPSCSHSTVDVPVLQDVPAYISTMLVHLSPPSMPIPSQSISPKGAGAGAFLFVSSVLRIHSVHHVVSTQQMF